MFLLAGFALMLGLVDRTNFIIYAILFSHVQEPSIIPAQNFYIFIFWLFISGQENTWFQISGWGLELGDLCPFNLMWLRAMLLPIVDALLKLRNNRIFGTPAELLLLFFFRKSLWAKCTPFVNKQYDAFSIYLSLDLEIELWLSN